MVKICPGVSSGASNKHADRFFMILYMYIVPGLRKITWGTKFGF